MADVPGGGGPPAISPAERSGLPPKQSPDHFGLCSIFGRRIAICNTSRSLSRALLHSRQREAVGHKADCRRSPRHTASALTRAAPPSVRYCSSDMLLACGNQPAAHPSMALLRSFSISACVVNSLARRRRPPSSSSVWVAPLNRLCTVFEHHHLNQRVRRCHAMGDHNKTVLPRDCARFAELWSRISSIGFHVNNWLVASSNTNTGRIMQERAGDGEMRWRWPPDRLAASDSIGNAQVRFGLCVQRSTAMRAPCSSAGHQTGSPRNPAESRNLVIGQGHQKISRASDARTTDGCWHQSQ